MVFSRIEFLYYFLPVTLLIYFIAPTIKGSPRVKNLALLVASLVFYAWGEPVYVVIMITQCISAWFFGICIDKYPSKAKFFMIVSVSVSFSALVFFKYADFFISNINNAIGGGLPLVGLLMPVGISFYTFQIVSYTFDLYYGKTKVQYNPLDLSTYVALFPQLIAGPIVRYEEVAKELAFRRHTLKDFSQGARRFVIGLAKKVLIANQMGELVEIYKNSPENSVLFTWLYMVSFALQIYFDFSGYSDMAIGLGKILGFKFPENFNYPYIAESITNFWRRWHMTLSSWFKDYVYIPLGGNRVKPARHLVNIMAVWALTGFWHGADWNFLIWGVYFGLVLLAEKFYIGSLLQKLPRFARHLYVMLVVFIGWTLFDAGSISQALAEIGAMIGIGVDTFAGAHSLYYLRSYLVLIIIGVVGATPMPKYIAGKIDGAKISAVLEPLAVAALLFASTAFIVDGSFNPFIYFRF